MDRLLLLSAIQNGKPGAVARPQGFERLASIVVAVATTRTLFDTRALSVNPVVVCWPSSAAAIAAAAARGDREGANIAERKGRRYAAFQNMRMQFHDDLW